MSESKLHPVAWMYHGIRYDGTQNDSPSFVTRPEYMDAMSEKKGAKVVPLYASPPEVEQLRAEVERLREEVERLRAERDALRIAAREYLQTAGGAIQSGKFDMTGTADTAQFSFKLVGTTDMAHVMRQAMQRLYSLAFDRAEPCPAGLETLREPDKEDGR